MTDAKLTVIKHKAGVRRGDVIAILDQVMYFAAINVDRGRIDNFDLDQAMVNLEYPEEEINAVLHQFRERDIIGEDDYLINWEKHQRGKWDNSTPRVQRLRAKRAAEAEVQGKKKAPSKKKLTNEDTAEDFDTFWSLYPSRGGKTNPRGEAHTIFTRHRNNKVPAEDMIEGAGLYREERDEEVSRDGSGAQTYTAMATTWLNNSRWISKLPNADESGTAYTGAEEVSEFSKALDKWHDDGRVSRKPIPGDYEEAEPPIEDGPPAL